MLVPDYKNLPTLVFSKYDNWNKTLFFWSNKKQHVVSIICITKRPKLGSSSNILEKWKNWRDPTIFFSVSKLFLRQVQKKSCQLDFLQNFHQIDDVSGFEAADTLLPPPLLPLLSWLWKEENDSHDSKNSFNQSPDRDLFLGDYQMERHRSYSHR